MSLKSAKKELLDDIKYSNIRDDLDENEVFRIEKAIRDIKNIDDLFKCLRDNLAWDLESAIQFSQKQKIKGEVNIQTLNRRGWST